MFAPIGMYTNIVFAIYPLVVVFLFCFCSTSAPSSSSSFRLCVAPFLPNAYATKAKYMHTSIEFEAISSSAAAATFTYKANVPRTHQLLYYTAQYEQNVFLLLSFSSVPFRFGLNLFTNWERARPSCTH